ncbi:Molecular chaperone Hsp90 OS=Streptomyces cyaneofuscatus OX=66883 GN=G3I52_20255 PE=4 SV=1 [Streptomyces cyaneofuscatus]
MERAADAYAELLGTWQPVSTGTIDLVPGPLGKGGLDGALRGAILARLPRVAFLEPAAPRDPEAEPRWADDWDRDCRTGAPPPPPSRPSRPRSSKASGPRPYGSSPRCCPVCCPQAWSAAPSSAPSASPASR